MPFGFIAILFMPFGFIAILFMPIGFIAPEMLKLFGFPIFLF
jgi:hypothetical protein